MNAYFSVYKFVYTKSFDRILCISINTRDMWEKFWGSLSENVSSFKKIPFTRMAAIDRLLETANSILNGFSSAQMLASFPSKI